MMSRLRVIPVVVVLIVALTGRPAAAAGAQDRRGPLQEGLSLLWSWIAERLPFEHTVAATCDQGSHIDPNGRCLSGLVAMPGGQSLRIDPNGSTTDQGSHMDPDG